MSAQISTSRIIDSKIIASLVLTGDLRGFKPEEKVEFYKYRCEQAGLDPAAKPFDLLILNGKEVLYANASCSQQLTVIHKLSHEITGREKIDDIFFVSCKVTGPDNRRTENVGAVCLANLKGEALANAYMKATTKAIRRSILAHCSLGMLDVTEVDSIVGAQSEHLVESLEIHCDPINENNVRVITNEEYEKLLNTLKKHPDTCSAQFINNLTINAAKKGYLDNSGKLSGYIYEKYIELINRLTNDAKRETLVNHTLGTILYPQIIKNS